MTTGHRLLLTFEILCALAVVVYFVHVWEGKKESPTVTIEKQRDSANVIIINPTPSQTIIGKEPTVIPTDYKELVEAFKQAIRERDEVNKYDSVVTVKHDTDTVAVIPYHITTKGKLLEFSMTPTVITTTKTITRELNYQITGSLGLHAFHDKTAVSVNVGYQNRRGIYEIGHEVGGKGWNFKVGIPIISKYK